MTRFHPGDLVKISPTSKSKYKEAIGIVEGYCHGHYSDICRVKLWHNKTIQIFDRNLTSVNLVNKSRCRKCIYELDCTRDKDLDGKCPKYKRDAPDGGYYG